MNLLRYPFLLPFFVHGALGRYDTFDSLCPGDDGNTVSLSVGEYTVSCGGYFEWGVTGVRVDSQGAASPEECARFCSGSVDCDAVVFDGGACWEYSAQGQTLDPLSDSQGRTILLHSVVKIDPNDPNNQIPQPPPRDYEQELLVCEQGKGQLERDLKACVADRDNCNKNKSACNTAKQKVIKERDNCLKRPVAPPSGPNKLDPANFQCNPKTFGKTVYGGGRRYRIVGNRSSVRNYGNMPASWVSAGSNCNIDCCLAKCTRQGAKVAGGNAHTNVLPYCNGAVVTSGGRCGLAVSMRPSNPLSTTAKTGDCILQPY
ncbi:hypothetical protein BDV39DRAFT_203000 [Aspergillus sergii]|uniref:Apple domain-containing protein n=1 Tax=Aspergillus sergii TaxID=1034303 RepID=A0A5N6XAJ6_9EURO|nr:hypothetical protein BDV39DRAFT_203000 [Aspergillus sergii]